MASWFQFPANDHIDIDSLKTVDGIFLSHTHEDHFDPWFLEQLDRTKPIIIAKFNSPDLRHRLSALGFQQLLELSDGEPQTFGDLCLTTWRDEDHGMLFDSAIMVESGGVRALNLNDCRLDENTAKQIGREQPVDVLLKYFSGASSYPIVYEYEPEQKTALCRQKRQNSFRSLVNYANWTQSKMIVPCSGPAAFLDEALFEYNDFENSPDNPFPNMAAAVEYLDSCNQPATLVMPGDQWNVQTQGLQLQQRQLQPDTIYGNLRSYLTEYAQKKRPLILDQFRQLDATNQSPQELFQEKFDALEESHFFFTHIDLDVLWEFTGKPSSKLWMSLSPGRRPILAPFDSQPFRYRYTLESRFAIEILRRDDIDWEDFFLSLRYTAWRDPDQFQYHFYSLLKHLDPDRFVEAERHLLEKQEAEETFELEHNGKKLRVQRYCPHLQSDLREVGVVDGNTLTCQRHGWSFCLPSGECQNVKGIKLKISANDPPKTG